MKVVAIIAASINNVIGVDGKLPWNSPSDLANFQKETMGHTVLMGRKTWESLPRTSKGRLPGRQSHILTRECEVAGMGMGGIWTDPSRAVCELSGRAALNGKDKIFIIGGAEIFKQALELDLIDEVWLTRMLVKVEDVPGAVYFPQEMLEGWPVAIETKVRVRPEVDPYYRFERYENPKNVKKEEPEMPTLNQELDQANAIIAAQRELLAHIVDGYSKNWPVTYELAKQCGAQLGQLVDERPPQTGEAEGSSPLAAEVASAVGEQLKAALIGAKGGIFKIEKLTINIGK